MAGTAIAVALVPPVCAMGLTLATGHYEDAHGAGLLYAANLLGILIGGIATLAIREPISEKAQSSASITPSVCAGLGVSELGGRPALRPLRAPPV